MRTKFKTFLGTAVVAVALASGPALNTYAQTPNQGSGATTQGGHSGSMMGQGSGNMMGSQSGMKNMMQQMSQMMDTCNQMMKSPDKKG